MSKYVNPKKPKIFKKKKKKKLNWLNWLFSLVFIEGTAFKHFLFTNITEFKVQVVFIFQ